ncbi:MAG: flavodoxin family protein [Vicinamibacterales bacterium]
MADVNVLVTFYSRYGGTERLALAAGVGAIQAKANIRLRRIADRADPETIQADPEWTRNLARMNMDYVAPRPADPIWADVIVLATPENASVEVERYVDSLRSLGSMAGKIAAPLASGHNESALRPIYALAACAGLIVVPAPAAEGDAVTNAQAYGRRVAQMARALKERS